MINLIYKLINKFYLENQKNDISKILLAKNLIQNIKKISNLNEAKNLMRKNNPMVIPRNNLVEDAIKKAVNGNTATYNRFLKILSTPYKYQDGLENFMKPPEKKFEECFQTYCGT